MTIEKLQLDFNSVRVGFTAAIKLDSQQNWRKKGAKNKEPHKETQAHAEKMWSTR